MATLVTGNIELPDSADFSGATLFVSVESIGMMDMPATVIAETILGSIDSNNQPFSFSIDGTVGNSEGPFNLRAHMSLDGSKDVRKGDYITKRTYTVLKTNDPDYIEVKVEKV
ncbi:MAG: hypothetical protein Phog2KO_47630 [Phototrophicaceae bacterium]